MFQDVVPPKKTIRDIPVPENRKVRVGNALNVPTRPSVDGGIPKFTGGIPPLPPESSGGGRPPFWRGSFFEKFMNMPQMPRKGLVWSIGGFLILLVAAFGAKYLFVHASVTVYPRGEQVTINAPFTAKKDAVLGELKFEVMTLTKEGNKIVPATGEKTVETKANGTITIYNDYSSASRRLIKNTRFETPEGLIYRVQDSVVVPGKKTVSGQSTPGSIDVVVYADQPGDSYNVALKDFTIPGFKGDPRYKGFYARSKAPMTGGFSGVVKTASPEDLVKARTEISQSLKDELLREANAQKPADFVLFDKAIYIETEDLSAPMANEVKYRATLYGVIFARKDISRAIAEKYIKDFGINGAEEVDVPNLESLTFTPNPAETKPWESGVLSFILTGDATVAWLFNAESFKKDLASQPRERMQTVLDAYQSIDHAKATIRPFWRSSFPDDPQQISVSISSGE